MTLALAAVAASASEAVAGPNGSSGATPVRSCESLAALSLANTTIDSAVADPGGGDQPPSCQVHLSVTHPPAGDDVNIDIWLPTRTWNGRFQGTGGGGFSGGSPANLPEPLRNGYAAGATDTGHAGARGSFALNPDGTLNWQLIEDNGYLAVHEMTVAGKALVRAFYGTGPRYSYFNGCSTGGRQGLIEAQRYADDYDGVAAGSPAINATKLRVVQLWGELVMLRARNFVAQCKFEAAAAGELDVKIRRPSRLATGVARTTEQLFAVGYAACFEAAMLLAASLKLGAELAVELPSIEDRVQAVELVRVAHGSAGTPRPPAAHRCRDHRQRRGRRGRHQARVNR
jgi:Tannase and feruloyl esterase